MRQLIDSKLMRQPSLAKGSGMTSRDVLNKDEWDLWHAWTEAQRVLAYEIDRGLQAEFGISKAEFSIAVTLLRSPSPSLRVIDVGESLGWEKSRVSHLLTRMEARGLLERAEGGASGRRTGVKLTVAGRQLAERAIAGHAINVRRYFFDALSPEQLSAIRVWSEQMVARARIS